MDSGDNIKPLSGIGTQVHTLRAVIGFQIAVLDDLPFMPPDFTILLVVPVNRILLVAFPNGYVSSFRMLPSEAEGYAKSINSLKEKYKGKIDIKLGFELEYYPALFEKEIEFLKTFNYDYLILGQHYVDNEYEDYAIYSDSPTKSPAVLDKYISQVILGAKSGLFTYVAHPDLINFKGDNKLYIQKMTYMANELKKLDIPLEFNFLGYTDKRNYPNNDFWQIVC